MCDQHGHAGLSQAIVTGAGQGLGFGMAQALVNEGVSVVMTGRVQQKLDTKAEILREQGGKVLAIPGDVDDREAVKAMVAQTLEAFGRIDILVNNAQTLVRERPMDELEDRHWHSSIQSGLFGSIYCMQEAYPSLKVRGGSIINFGSIMAVDGTIGTASYAAAKEAIRGMSRVAARDWGKDGIRVNVICPSATSEALEKYFEAFPDKLSLYTDKMALGRFADPVKDLGALVIFLASDDCFLTGQTLFCDGGNGMH